jgi:GNAT superfamily N-acetyltransferase
VGGPRVRPPERLNSEHDAAAFRNGKHATLDDWLHNRALASEGLSARTYVICETAMSSRVVGYYAISAAMEQRVALPNAKLRRGMPDQVPLLLVGRLALDVGYQGQGLGAMLLSDALRRCVAASEIAGVRGVIAHAIDEDAATFYERLGFVHTPLGERIMLMPIEAARMLFS